jgi:hypothetical protein
MMHGYLAISIANYLLSSFGVVDLIRDRNGNWLVLEVGTDGIYNYVDREIDSDELISKLCNQIAKTFLAGFYFLTALFAQLLLRNLIVKF